jgi:hypothetical protein
MSIKAARTTAKGSPAILERIANNDTTAVEECVRKHGSWIWAVALKNSVSTQAAEELTMNIFCDIRQFAHRFKQSGLSEEAFLALIARRRVRGKTETGKMNIPQDNKFYKSFQSYAKNGEK